MATLPIGKDQNSGTLLANHACDLQPVFPGVLHASVRNIQRIAEACLQDTGSIRSFASAIVRAASGAHFAVGKIKDSGEKTALSHFEQRAAAGLLHVITMSGQSEDVQRWSAQSASPSMVTFSRTIRRWPAISLIVGNNFCTCSSESMNVSTRGSLPPASTSVEVFTRL